MLMPDMPVLNSKKLNIKMNFSIMFRVIHKSRILIFSYRKKINNF